MLFLLQLDFQQCSPTDTNKNIDFYPQLNRQWWKKQGSFYSGTFASLFTDQQYLEQNQLRIILIGTDSNYLQSFREKLRNIIIFEYISILQVDVDATLNEYAEKLYNSNMYLYDLAVLLFDDCDNISQTKNLTSIKDFSNKFYLKRFISDLPKSRIKTLQYIQKSIQMYRQVFQVNNKLSKAEYFNFTLEKITFAKTLLVTSILDTTSKLYVNSITFCPVSPNYLPQTSMMDCQISVPIGMGTRSYQKGGSISDGFQFVIKIYQQFFNERVQQNQILSILKDSTQIKKKLYKSQIGIGNGISDFNKIFQISQQYKNNSNLINTITDQQDILSSGKLKSGDILYLLSFQVYKIYVTIRGGFDPYEPMYENSFLTTLLDNQQSMLKYTNISIFICQKVGNSYMPSYVGTFIETNRHVQYILQSTFQWNMQFNQEVMIWFSYQQNISLVQKEIKQQKKLDTDLQVAIQMTGNRVNISLETICDLSDRAMTKYHLFRSNGTIIYQVCLINNKIKLAKIQPGFQFNDLYGIRLNTGSFCNLHFCASEFNSLDDLNAKCAKTQDFNITDQSLLKALELCFFCAIFYLIYIYLGSKMVVIHTKQDF